MSVRVVDNQVFVGKALLTPEPADAFFRGVARNLARMCAKVVPNGVDRYFAERRAANNARKAAKSAQDEQKKGLIYPQDGENRHV